MNKLIKENKKLKIISCSYIIIIIFLFLFMGGSIMNFLAIKHNEGKMPFLASYDFQTPTHFSYQDNSEVKYPLFTDRFRIFNFIWSLGDLIMSFAILGLFVNGFITFNKLRRLRKK